MLPLAHPLTGCRPPAIRAGFDRGVLRVRTAVVGALFWAATLGFPLRADDPPRSRAAVVLEGNAARLVIDLAGGSIGEFRLSEIPINPLSWSHPRRDNKEPAAFGHFLCLDRWGPPSEAEGRRGMPYHGEASHVTWTTSGIRTNEPGWIATTVSARLPIAGLSVHRTIRLSRETGVFQVNETVINENPLGRVLNLVQHPTIAPPFLDVTTRVDCNGARGFAQGGSLPDPEKPTRSWPRAVDRRSYQSKDLRWLSDDPEPNVASFVIEEAHGWVTATSGAHGLLLGYLWPSQDYPWVSLWRDVQDGRPAARGLEFGTTGLHQPFADLVGKNRILGRPLFEYLDAGASIEKRYVGFLVKVPRDFAGVRAVRVETGRLLILEAAGGRGRSVVVPVSLENLPE